MNNEGITKLAMPRSSKLEQSTNVGLPKLVERMAFLRTVPFWI